MTGPAAELLEALEARGVRFTAQGDRLHADPAGPLAAADLEALRAHKPAILALLEDRERALLELREFHLRMGLSLEDALMAEHALRSGLVREVVVILPPASMGPPGNSWANGSATPAATPAPLSRS